MPVKTLLSQKEALCFLCPEAPPTSLGSEASGIDHHTVENVYCGQTNQYFRSFLEEMGGVCSGPKKKSVYGQWSIFNYTKKLPHIEDMSNQYFDIKKRNLT